MENHILAVCRSNPAILLFLALGVGYYIGKFKVKGFSLGATASVLLVALALGQLPGVQIPGHLKTVSFALFLFCIGYSVGPQFFGALKKQGLNYIWIALVVAVAALGTALALGKLFGFSPGTTAGLLAGALTTSAAIGTAEGAIAHLPGLTQAARTALETDTAIAYAITYIFGTIGGVLMFSLLPKIMGDDLKDEAAQLEASFSGGGDDVDKSPELFSWVKQLTLRAYRVETPTAIGKSVRGIEGLFAPPAGCEYRRHSDLSGRWGRGAGVRADFWLGAHVASHLRTDSFRQPVDSPESGFKPLHRLCGAGGRRSSLGGAQNHGANRIPCRGDSDHCSGAGGTFLCPALFES